MRVLGGEGDRVRGRVDDVREAQDSELWLAPSDGILHWHEDSVALADERITFVWMWGFWLVIHGDRKQEGGRPSILGIQKASLPWTDPHGTQVCTQSGSSHLTVPTLFQEWYCCGRGILVSRAGLGRTMRADGVSAESSVGSRCPGAENHWNLPLFGARRLSWNPGGSVQGEWRGGSSCNCGVVALERNAEFRSAWWFVPSSIFGISQ